MADFTTGHALDFTEVGTETDPTDPLEPLDGDELTDAEADSDQTNYAEPGQGESFSGQDPTIWSIQGDADDGSTFTSSTPAIETETLPTDGDEPDSEPLQNDNPAVEDEPTTEPEREPEEEPQPEPVRDADAEPEPVTAPTPEPQPIERDDELETDDQLILDENTAGPGYEDAVQSLPELAYTGTQMEQEPELDIESEDELEIIETYAELEMLDTENDLMTGEILFEETNLVEFMDIDDFLFGDPFGDEDGDGFTDFVDLSDDDFTY